jgi:hypothetical protein
MNNSTVKKDCLINMICEYLKHWEMPKIIITKKKGNDKNAERNSKCQQWRGYKEKP